jgi:hypothetical protein
MDVAITMLTSMFRIGWIDRTLEKQFEMSLSPCAARKL